jgi:hypothetical protein
MNSVMRSTKEKPIGLVDLAPKAPFLTYCPVRPVMSDEAVVVLP